MNLGQATAEILAGQRAQQVKRPLADIVDDARFEAHRDNLRDSRNARCREGQRERRLREAVTNAAWELRGCADSAADDDRFRLREVARELEISYAEARNDGK